MSRMKRIKDVPPRLMRLMYHQRIKSLQGNQFSFSTFIRIESHSCSFSGRIEMFNLRETIDYMIGDLSVAVHVIEHSQLMIQLKSESR